MYSKIIYSGLLHDIGKLIMRAEGFNKNHSATGVEYLNRFNNELLKDKSVTDSIKYHHAKYLKKANLDNSHIAYIIYEADNISSGVDRRDEDLENETEKLKNKYSKFDKSLCLSSVFNKIKTETKYSYLLRDLENKSPNYPKSLKEEDIKATNNKYKDLKSWIDKNIQTIQNPNSLLQLLEATMSFVPSSTNTEQVADISLYDHSKLTAAIASCMYQYFQENNITDYKDECFNEEKITSNRNKNYYKLVSFDLSGIQNFIYTISTNDALKSLRARSFYLEFLMEHIQNELLENLNLSRANILYSGGGHSYLLLPNTKQTEIILTETQTKVNDWFLSKFKTELYLSYAEVECSSENLKNSTEVFKKLSKELSKSKLQRYSENQLEKIFSVDGDFDDTRECKICKNSAELDENGTCEFCRSLINLGGYLVKEKDFAIVVADRKEDFNTFKEKSEYAIELPSINGKSKYFCIAENKENLTPEQDKRYYSINDFSSGEYFYTNIWMGDYCMHKGKAAYSFEDYANETEGIKRIAVLRADVDNLGSTFVNGFGKYSSISRYATLSRMLNMFYKRYINALCDKKNIAIVYSGGDDVFVVGAWNDVLQFGRELRNAFYEYTCEKLTISAGIGFFSSKYPISKMAELTGELEDFAKKNNNNKKDSVALFGEDITTEHKDKKTEQFVFTWNEFDKVLDIQKEIEKKCYFDENQKVEGKIFFSTALIYKIITLINSSDKINVARFAYTLARIENKENQSVYQDFKKYLYNLFEKDRKKLLTALYLIVYKNRSKNKQEA